MDLIDRQAAIDAVKKSRYLVDAMEKIIRLPSTQPDIKQAVKSLMYFIESCPVGDSYLITPDGERLKTDWGYVAEGIQLIYDWCCHAERRTDGSDSVQPERTMEEFMYGQDMGNPEDGSL